MTDANVNASKQPLAILDPLTELLRSGARDLIAKAVESELQVLLEQYAHRCLPDGRQAVDRNGYLPERTLQTTLAMVYKLLEAAQKKWLRFQGFLNVIHQI